MMRVHVTGNAGAGKTTLAREIGERLGVPVFGLDAIVWQPGWKKTDTATRALAEQALIDRPAWVIEGVSPRVRDAADLVVFLDTPPWRCLTRALRRNLPYLFRSRPELPPRCPELLILPRLVKIIFRFPGRVRPSILADAAGSARYRMIRSAADRDRFLDEMISARATAASGGGP